MSAKKARPARTPTAPASSSTPRATGIDERDAFATQVAETGTSAAPAWIESTDPRKRQVAQIAQVVVWVYVAALWLLALDQWFHWGIFGPKLPPIG